MTSSSEASPGTSANNNNKPTRGKKSQRQQSPVPPVPPRKNSSDKQNDEDPVLQSIASKPSVLHSPQVTLTCYIPSSCIGAVIGRRGSTIAQIQRSAQQYYGTVRLSIVGHDDTCESVPYTFTPLDYSSTDWTPVVIRGDPCAALCAAQRLRQVADDTMDDVVMDVPLNKSKFSSLIGKRGMILAGLSADTNVRIMIPQRALRIDLIQLEGELDNVKVCLEKIVSLLASTSSFSNNRTKRSNSTEDTVSALLQLSVLPSQTKLRVVAKKTETSIQKKRQDDSWLITVYGSDSDKVQSAISMLEAWKNNKSSTTSQQQQQQQRRSRPQNRKPRSGKKGRGGGAGTTTSTAAAACSPPTASPPDAPKAES